MLHVKNKLEVWQESCCYYNNIKNLTTCVSEQTVPRNDYREVSPSFKRPKVLSIKISMESQEHIKRYMYLLIIPRSIYYDIKCHEEQAKKI